MSPKLSINFNEKQYEELKEGAQAENKSLTDFILSHLPITFENKLELTLLEARISELGIGEFTIPDLFTREEWIAFTKGSRLVTPKNFYKKVTNSEVPRVRFLSKNSANLARYHKE